MVNTVGLKGFSAFSTETTEIGKKAESTEQIMRLNYIIFQIRP